MTLTKNDSIRKYESQPPVSAVPPDARFDAWCAAHRDPLRNFVVPFAGSCPPLRGLAFRAGLAYPLHTVIDEGIKGLCAIPFRRKNGSVAPCAGITDHYQGCPPHSPPVAATVALLRRAAAFLVFQFAGITGTSTQKQIHLWTLQVERTLGEAGHGILAGYSSGPCRICPTCADDECRAPAHRRFALESCGIWIDRLCRNAAKQPVCGDDDWGIEWVIDWNLPTQSPPTFKSVTGILLE